MTTVPATEGRPGFGSSSPKRAPDSPAGRALSETLYEREPGPPDDAFQHHQQLGSMAPPHRSGEPAHAPPRAHSVETVAVHLKAGNLSTDTLKRWDTGIRDSRLVAY